MMPVSDSGTVIALPAKDEEGETKRNSVPGKLDSTDTAQVHRGGAEIINAPPTTQSPPTETDVKPAGGSNLSMEAGADAHLVDLTPVKDANMENSGLKAEESEEESTSDSEDVAEIRDVLHSRRAQPNIPMRLHPDYINILEQRVSVLERRCNVLYKGRKSKKGKKSIIGVSLEEEEDMNAPLPAPRKPPKMKPPKKPTMELGLNFQFWTSFIDRKQDSEKQYMIDVLVGEPEIADIKKPRRRNAWARFIDASHDLGSEDVFDDVTAQQPQVSNERDLQIEIRRLRHNSLPERIRINAKAVLSIFHKVLGTETFPCESSTTVILRPFKAFLQNWDEMRHIMTEITNTLEKLLRERGEDGAKAENGVKDQIEEDNVSKRESITKQLKHCTAQSEPNMSYPFEEGKSHDRISPSEWYAILADMELFHCEVCTNAVNSLWPTVRDVKKSFEAIFDLLDNYIKPLNTKLRNNDTEMVHFRDLWHLFYTGDEVMVRENPKEEEHNIAGRLALKVLRTGGGRRAISRANADGMPPPPPPLPGVSAPPPTDRIRPVNGINPFCVDAYYLDFDGVKLVPVRRRFVINPYPGERRISDLVIFPIHHASKSDMTREALVVRGQKFVKFATSNTIPYLDCTGLELSTKEELNDKVIVDMKQYFKAGNNERDVPGLSELTVLDGTETHDCQMGGNCFYPAACSQPTSIIPDESIDSVVLAEYRALRPEFKPLISLSGPQSNWLPPYSICHFRLFAYKLRSREWVRIDVDSLEAPKASDVNMGFKELVLPNDHKDILESQVREHFRKRGAQGSNEGSKVAAEDDMDLVRGKGQGLIILLHGAPGVGKTATAECIADLVQKPLYPITCGDLGSTAEEVEKNLKKHFTLASKWDCVMLLDEADVFLAKRRHDDLHRNSIVSVFLRMLEYYKGLLFLTTNRVGTFDEAFKSRVHISLFYPSFGRATTIRVWKTFIKQTKNALERNNRTRINIHRKEIIQFAKDHWDQNPKARWNGRQIRNAFHTAVAMAEFSARGGNSPDVTYKTERDVGIEVGRAQFEKISKTVRGFDDYMREAVGMSYEAKAAKERVRAKVSEENTKSKGSDKKSKKKVKKKIESDDSSSEDSEEALVLRSKSEGKKPKTYVEQSDDDDDDDTSSDED